MLWTKCNKILVDSNNKIINCDNCPCGYWTIVGIKWRSYNCETEQSNQCSWQYTVFPTQVIDNKINWDYGCIEISRKIGLCCKKRGKYNCYTDCFDWNDEGDCIDEQQICECIQFQVYNMAGCFDKYEDFQSFFWSGCGVSMSDGKYPDIFQIYYGQKTMTSKAYECVQNYWNEVFEQKYLINIQLELHYLRQNWSEGVGGYSYEMISDEYCCNEDGDPATQYENGCPEGYTQCTYESEVQDGWCAYAYMENNRSLDYQIKTAGIDEENGNECCNEVSTAEALPEIDAYISEKINDKSVYVLNNKTSYKVNSYNLCIDMYYKSWCFDNSWWDPANCRFEFNWYKFKIMKNEKTPASAKGVKFIAKITHIRENVGYGKDERTETKYQQQLLVNFNQFCEDLPLATNINLLTLLDTPRCEDDCDWNWETDGNGNLKHWWKVQPRHNFDDFNGVFENNAWQDIYEIKLIAKEYI